MHRLPSEKEGHKATIGALILSIIIIYCRNRWHDIYEEGKLGV